MVIQGNQMIRLRYSIFAAKFVYLDKDYYLSILMFFIPIWTFFLFPLLQFELEKNNDAVVEENSK